MEIRIKLCRQSRVSRLLKFIANFPDPSFVALAPISAKAHPLHQLPQTAACSRATKEKVRKSRTPLKSTQKPTCTQLVEMDFSVDSNFQIPASESQLLNRTPKLNPQSNWKPSLEWRSLSPEAKSFHAPPRSEGEGGTRFAQPLHCNS